MKKISENELFSKLADQVTSLLAKDQAKKERLAKRAELIAQKTFDHDFWSNDIGRVKRCLNRFPDTDLEMKNKRGWTRLAVAASEGKESLARMLVKLGAKMDAKGPDEIPPLLRAARKGHTKIVQLFLDHGADIEIKDLHGKTALMLACSNGMLETATLLLDKGAETDAIDQHRKTALMQSYDDFHTPYFTITELLLDSGANADMKDMCGMTALDYVSMRHRQSVAKLFSTKAAKKQEIPQKKFEQACMDNKVKSARACLEKYSSLIDIRNNPTLLGKVCIAGHLKIAKLLLNRGAKIEQKTPDGKTALHVAARADREKVAELLISKGANLEAKDSYGHSPLDYASEESHKKLVKLLLKHGAKDLDGKTLSRKLIDACESRDISHAKELLEEEFNLEKQDSSGMTALMHAAARGTLEIAELLLNRGAKVATAAPNDWTALHYASAFNQKEMVSFLQTHGAENSLRDWTGYLLIPSKTGPTEILKYGKPDNWLK